MGRFVIDGPNAEGERHRISGRTRRMPATRGSCGRRPAAFSPPSRRTFATSELCATCHTLITKALGPGGKQIGELPEQVPYQEWVHSGYRERRSCQSCHMPEVEEEVAITSVLGQPRKRGFRGMCSWAAISSFSGF